MAGRKHTGNNRLMHEARKETERRRSSVPLGANPIDVLQEVIDGAVADLRFAQEQVDRLGVDEVFRQTAQGTVPNEWIRLRDVYRDEVERVANNLVRNGIAERIVNIKAAEAALMVQAVQAAAIDAGIPPEQVRVLGAALRERLDQSRPMRETASAVVALHQPPKELTE